MYNKSNLWYNKHMKRLSILLTSLLVLSLIPSGLTYVYPNIKMINYSPRIKFELPAVEPMNFSESDYYWMAKNVYHEAGNQTRDGFLAVMQVTMNRVANSKYPSTIKEVVTQKNKRGCQFSWYCMKKVPYDEEKFIQTYNYVKTILPVLHLIDDTTYGAVYYHAAYVKPYWAKVKEKTVKIGDHIFYREKSRV